MIDFYLYFDSQPPLKIPHDFISKFPPWNIPQTVRKYRSESEQYVNFSFSMEQARQLGKKWILDYPGEAKIFHTSSTDFFSRKDDLKLHRSKWNYKENSKMFIYWWLIFISILEKYILGSV